MRPNILIDGAGESVDSGAEEAAAKAATEAETKAKLGKAEALALGITETILNAFPELRPIFDMFVLGNIAEARLAYFDSNYYKNLTADSQSRRTKQKTQPGVYAQEYNDWLIRTKNNLIQKGFMWNPELESFMEEYYLDGLSESQIGLKILNSGKMGSKIGGSALGTLNALKEYANDQGINTILSKSYWDKVSIGLLDGSLTDETIQEELKGFAISAFPAYAKGIEAGRSFGLQTSALRQTIANLLEVDVDTITNDNAIFKELVGYINPKTNTPEPISLWQAEKIVKTKDEWNFTKNARDTYDALGLKVLRDWGLA
jgi:hypothetical protein